MFACQEEVCVSREQGQGVLSCLTCIYVSASVRNGLCLCVEIAKQIKCVNCNLNLNVSYAFLNFVCMLLIVASIAYGRFSVFILNASFLHISSLGMS